MEFLANQPNPYSWSALGLLQCLNLGWLLSGYSPLVSRWLLDLSHKSQLLSDLCQAAVSVILLRYLLVALVAGSEPSHKSPLPLAYLRTHIIYKPISTVPQTYFSSRVELSLSCLWDLSSFRLRTPLDLGRSPRTNWPIPCLYLLWTFGHTLGTTGSYPAATEPRPAYPSLILRSWLRLMLGLINPLHIKPIALILPLA